MGKFDYPIQKLTLPRHMVELSPEDLARVNRENREMARLWTREGPRLFSLPLGKPLDPLPAGGRFGHRRIINGSPRSPHGGADYSVDDGTPVLAAADGTVAMVADQFFGGNAVFVDHGDSLISMYMHMSRVDVAEGQQGAPGRAGGRRREHRARDRPAPPLRRALAGRARGPRAPPRGARGDPHHRVGSARGGGEMRERIEPVGEARRFGPGIGFNWFDYLGMGGSYAHPPEYYPLTDACYPPLEDQASWALILGELDRLRPGFIRFGIPPDPHVDERGRIVTDTVHLRRLDLVARWAASRGCTILLDTFLLPTRYELPRPAGARLPWDGGMYQLGAADNRAYAREFVAPLLQHVCLERGLEAVRFFNPVNEPMAYGVYQMPEGGPDTYVHYVEMYREMREALDAAGVSRDRLGLVGCDANEPEGWPVLEMTARGVDIDPFVDAYSIHYYRLSFDYLTGNPANREVATTIRDAIDKHTGKIARYCRARGKPLWAPEIGTFHYGWRFGDPAGPTTLEATLTVAEALLRAVNAGVDAFAFWCFMNPNTIDGHWRIVGIEDGRLVRAAYPCATYGLLSRLVRPGSRVQPLVSRPQADRRAHLHATAFTAPSGERTLLLVNDHPDEEVEADLAAPRRLGRAALRLPTGGSRTPSPSPSPRAPPWSATRCECAVPPMSLLAFHDEALDGAPQACLDPGGGLGFA